jgi:hypothetical protein
MSKDNLRQLLITKYGVYPPDNATYDEMARLRKILNEHAKPKQSFGRAKKNDAVQKFDPPPLESFEVEEESSKNVVSNTHEHVPMELTPRTNYFMTNLSPIVNVQTPRILTFSEYPLSDEDCSESPTTSSKRVLSWPEESPLKKTITE